MNGALTNDRKGIFIEAGEVAELLGVPLSWVREQTRREMIPHRKFGKYRRYLLDEVLTWADSLRSGPKVSARRPTG